MCNGNGIKGIEVKGISENGYERTMNYTYPMFAKNDFEAIAKAMEYADREYNCEYDENGKAIPGTEYKEFVKITSVHVYDGI